ncbi:MAG: hypothetical protein AAF824_17790 [Bacteroidota bacterium]
MKPLITTLILVFITFPIVGRCQYQVQGTVIIHIQGKKKLLGRDTEYGAFQSKVGSTLDSPLLEADNNMIISLHPLDFTPTISPTQNAFITQVNQRFIPQVLPVMVGSVVYFLNEDNEYHNVYSRTPKSSFNIGRRSPGNTYPQKIRKPGLITISCDIHAHMNAVILSLETPYFSRVQTDGTFKVEGLPSGRYRAELFHKKYGTQIKEITIDQENIILTYELHEKS